MQTSQFPPRPAWRIYAMLAALAWLLCGAVPVQAQQPHRHGETKTACFGVGCYVGRTPRYATPSPPQIIERAPSVDLGRLETTAEDIKHEQRYQTHLLYGIVGQLQRSADLQLLGLAKQVSTPYPNPTQVPAAGPLPDPTKVPAAPPLPDPTQVPAAPPLPNPTQISPAAPLPSPVGIPPASSITSSRMKLERPWPNVRR